MEIDLDLILPTQLNLLTYESIDKHMRAEKTKDDDRCTVAAAQVVMCHKMLEFYLATDDYEVFMEEMETVRGEQEAMYRDARAANDRHWAIILLARLRLLGTLCRRLAIFEREKALISLRSESRNPH